jgi:ferritin-like metal-binding protein YciE
MAEAKLNQRDSKLVHWLNEAYAKEAELEADLTAHITHTAKASYKKRLREHLTETKAHKRQVAGRIKKLGGSATAGPTLPGIPKPVGEVAGKAVAAVKGQVGAARAVVSNQAETHLRNVQEELRGEHVEIAIYKRIQAFAEEVGDKETAELAKTIRRDEERMAKFLDSELTRLVKDVVRAEVPRDQRGTTTARRSRSTSRGSSAGRTRSPVSGRSRRTAARSSRSSANGSGSTRSRAAARS